MEVPLPGGLRMDDDRRDRQGGLVDLDLDLPPGDEEREAERAGGGVLGGQAGEQGGRNKADLKK